MSTSKELPGELVLLLYGSVVLVLYGFSRSTSCSSNGYFVEKDNAFVSWSKCESTYGYVVQESFLGDSLYLPRSVLLKISELSNDI